MIYIIKLNFIETDKRSINSMLWMFKHLGFIWVKLFFFCFWYSFYSTSCVLCISLKNVNHKVSQVSVVVKLIENLMNRTRLYPVILLKRLIKQLDKSILILPLARLMLQIFSAVGESVKFPSNNQIKLLGEGREIYNDLWILEFQFHLLL